MGSLVPSWDSDAPGKPPKGYEDYKDISCPHGSSKTKLSVPHEPISQQPPTLLRLLGGPALPASPPRLGRVSAPPAMQQPKHHHMLHGIAVPPSLSRASADSRSRGPTSSPSRRGGGISKMFRFEEGVAGAEDEIDLKKKEKWWARMSSGALNRRPDEGDEEEWRHGRYTLSDPMHTVHYAEPTAQQAQQQVQQTGEASREQPA